MKTCSICCLDIDHISADFDSRFLSLERIFYTPLLWFHAHTLFFPLFCSLEAKWIWAQGEVQQSHVISGLSQAHTPQCCTDIHTTKKCPRYVTTALMNVWILVKWQPWLYLCIFIRSKMYGNIKHATYSSEYSAVELAQKNSPAYMVFSNDWTNVLE